MTQQTVVSRALPPPQVTDRFLSVGLAASVYLDPYSASSPGTAPILNSLESISYSSSDTLAAFLSLGLS